MDTGTCRFPGLYWEFKACSRIHIDKDGGLRRLFTAVFMTLQTERRRETQTLAAAAVLVSFTSDSPQQVIIKPRGQIGRLAWPICCRLILFIC